jgi:hypothetical protein
VNQPSTGHDRARQGAAALRADRRTICRRRAWRPCAELPRHLAGKVGIPAGQLGSHVTGLIWCMAADAESCRRADQRRPGVLASAFRRRSGPSPLLVRNLYAPGTFIAVEELREIIRPSVGADPGHDPGSPRGSVSK